MKKHGLILFGLLIVFVLVIAYAHSQEDMQFVNSDAFKNDQRPPAVFRHDEHNEAAEIEECNECHHVYDDDGNLVEDESSEDQSCSDCHELKAVGRTPALMKAFHTNCKECHKAQKKGPLMCGQCHVRGLVFEE
jgi:hypothetical protein